MLTFGSRQQKPEVKQLLGDNHSYIRGNIATRGPCPGLNALANQGYLPRNGNNITLSEVETALMSALHMDKPLASALTNSLKPLVHKDKTFNLADMRQHNIIEHDASFTRLDFRQGDNYTFQPLMLQALLADADGGPVTVKSLAKTYVRRLCVAFEYGGDRGEVVEGADGYVLHGGEVSGGGFEE
ncbi:hypothetical protein EPUS_06859 [Endocarpon pusillum Z07020]|uniref:Heme haloperoxidase family profile domain-containing protein n=1 Tax=Endocarpon pusillum (strain Z07020 / HMAS-L-300199) TaxID=1263415 RepID=U1GXX9_ENDPU|nr:uncharacterized protein EPUS_06859 [Endocarpon pusillum Z07020]ERF76991.1 hypothetical protein EPUS_06859 [Endocarpon pusillum Z07020]